MVNWKIASREKFIGRPYNPTNVHYLSYTTGTCRAYDKGGSAGIWVLVRRAKKRPVNLWSAS